MRAYLRDRFPALERAPLVETRSSRYEVTADTRFFAAPMPSGQTAVADDREIVDVRWLSPGEALVARERGEISLRLPTMRNLRLFEGAASTLDALGRLAGRQITVIRPRLVSGLDGAPERTLLPGDPGYF